MNTMQVTLDEINALHTASATKAKDNPGYDPLNGIREWLNAKLIASGFNVTKPIESYLDLDQQAYIYSQSMNP